MIVRSSRTARSRIQLPLAIKECKRVLKLETTVFRELVRRVTRKFHYTITALQHSGDGISRVFSDAFSFHFSFSLHSMYVSTHKNCYSNFQQVMHRGHKKTRSFLLLQLSFDFRCLRCFERFRMNILMEIIHHTNFLKSVNYVTIQK